MESNQVISQDGDRLILFFTPVQSDAMNTLPSDLNISAKETDVDAVDCDNVDCANEAESKISDKKEKSRKSSRARYKQSNEMQDVASQMPVVSSVKKKLNKKKSDKLLIMSNDNN